MRRLPIFTRVGPQLNPPRLYEMPRARPYAMDANAIVPSTEAVTRQDYLAFLDAAFDHGAAQPDTDFGAVLPLIALLREDGSHAAKLKAALYALKPGVEAAVAAQRAKLDAMAAAAEAASPPDHARAAALRAEVPKVEMPTIVAQMHYLANELEARGHWDLQDKQWLADFTVYCIDHLLANPFSDTSPINPVPNNLVRGTFHRALGQMHAFRIAAHHEYGTGNERLVWESHWPVTWSDWFAEKDFAPNDTHYYWSGIGKLLEGLVALPHDIAFTDAQAQSRLWTRTMYEVTPDGLPPLVAVHFSRGQGAATRILALEMAAARIVADPAGDLNLAGQYRWVASRMFRWLQANVWRNSDRGPLHAGDTNVAGEGHLHLALTTLVMNDSIVPVEPSAASRTTERAASHNYGNAEKDREANGANTIEYEAHIKLLPERALDKLIFRSGWEPGSLFAMVEGYAYHSPMNPTAVVMYERHGAAQQEEISGKYLHNGASGVHIKNLDGREPYDTPPPPDDGTFPPDGQGAATLDDFQDGELASHGRLTVADYMAYPCDQERDILFVKNRFMMLRDTTTFNRPLPNVRVGPQWLTKTVHASAPNWLDCQWDEFLTVIDGEEFNVIHYINPPVRTLVYYAPIAGASMDIPDKAHAVVSTKYGVSGPRSDGDVLRFGCLLLPYNPEARISAAKLADGITVHVHTDTVLLMSLEIGTRREFMLLNPEKATVIVPAPDGDISTTAAALYLDYHGKRERGREEFF